MKNIKLPALLKVKGYAGFKDMPAAAQAFCVSFAYGHLPTDFPQMNTSIEAGNYATASTQCSLSGAAVLKNKAHANLLKFAQNVVDSKSDFDKVPANFDGI